MSICFPLSWSMSNQKIKAIIAGIWIVSSLVTAPWLLYFTIIPFEQENGRQIATCVESWPSKQLEKTYFILANLILMFVLPATLMILCHLATAIALSRQTVVGASSQVQRKRLQLINRSKMNSLRMSTMVFILFLLAWLPLYSVVARIKLVDRELTMNNDWLLICFIPFAQWFVWLSTLIQSRISCTNN